MPTFAQSLVSSLTGMNGPTFVAIDANRTIGGTAGKWLYVSEHGNTDNTGGGRVLRFNLSNPGAAAVDIGNGNFTSPDAMLIDSATGDLIVADRGRDRVVRITNTGTVVMTFGSGTVGAADEMHGPVGLARDGAGAIYVAEHGETLSNPVGAGGAFVSKYTISGTTATRVWRKGGEGSAAGQFKATGPYGVAVNGSSLLISDAFNFRIQVWDLNGNYQSEISVGSAWPLGLHIDSAGNLWIAESGSVDQVQKATTAGVYAGVTLSGGLSLPFDAAVDVAANLAYVADYNNDRVAVFDLSGGTASAPVISGNTTQAGTVGVSLTYNLTASNSPTSYASLDALPAGLTLNTGTGQVAGIPSAAGNTTVRFTATNSAGTSAPFSVTFNIAPASTPPAGINPRNAPVITSFDLGPNPTLTSANFRVVFDRDVTGLDATDFAVNTQGNATATITTVTTVSAHEYLVNFDYTGTNGSVQMAIKTSGTGIADTSSRAFVGDGITASPAITVNAQPPADGNVPVVSTFTAGAASGLSVTYTLTFNEPVTGFNAADLLAATSTGVTAQIGTITSSAGGATYTIPVTLSANGSVQLTVIGGVTANIRDAATNWFGGNGSATSDTAALSTGGGGGDTTAPTVSSFVVGTSSGSTVNFTLTFSEAVTGVDQSDFTVGGTGATGASVGVVSGSGTTYTVPVTYTATSGNLTVTLKNSGTGIADLSANALATGSTSAAYTITAGGGDTTAPSVASFVVGTNSAGTVNFTLTFSEAVTGVDKTDFTVGGTGATGAAVGTVTGSGTTYTVPVTYTATSGNITVTLKNSGTGIVDGSSNALATGATSAAFTITAGGGDTTAPSVTSFVVGSNSGSTVNFTVTFSESVTGVDKTDFTLGGTGATGAVVGTVTGSGTTYTVPVTFTATSGTLNVSFKTTGTGITDTAGNALVSSGGITSSTFNIPVSGGPDTTAPVVSSFTAGTPIAGSVLFNLTFSEKVNGVDQTDFVLSGSGATGASIGAVGGTGSSFTIPVTYTASSGTLQLTIKSSGTGIVDLSGNALGAANLASSTATITTSSGGGGGGGGGGVIIPPPVNTQKSQTITFTTPTGSIIVNQAFQLSALADSGGVIAYSVLSGNAALSGDMLTIKDTNPVVVRASQAGNSTWAAATQDTTFTAQKAAQSITLGANPVKAYTDGTVSLKATSSSGLPITYTVISGPATISGSTLTFTGSGPVVVRAAQTGSDSYAGTDTTFTISGAPIPRLINISSRVRVSANDGNGSSIAGFVVTGTSAKQILIRAVGPSLSAYGIGSPLANPTLKLFDSKGAVVASNTGWANDSKISAAGDGVGAFKLNQNSADSALLVTLQPGAYTAQVTSTSNSGTVLIEVYDVTANAAVPTKQLINISTRGTVGTSDDVLVGGFVVSGTEPKRVLVRAIGPGLTAYGVSGVVADPVLKIYNSSNTVIAQNDNWGTAVKVGSETPATSAEISAANTAAGAFPLTAGSADAAVVLTLNPGNYTAVVTGANNSSGAALMEIYELPNL